MARLVQFDAGEGEFILIEVEDGQLEGIKPIAKKPNEMAAKAKQTFDEALKNLTPMIKGVKKRLDALSDPADEVEVKFSVKLTGEAGAVLTKVGGEATYEITLKWKHS